jgi:hypothetical protein
MLITYFLIGSGLRKYFTINIITPSNLNKSRKLEFWVALLRERSILINRAAPKI